MNLFSLVMLFQDEPLSFFLSTLTTTSWTAFPLERTSVFYNHSYLF